MPPPPDSVDQLTRAVQETLDSVVSPTVRDSLIGQALTSAHEREIPGDPTRFRQFLDGPLQNALMRALGSELGRSVARELDRVTEPLVRMRAHTPPTVRRVLLRPRSNPPSTRPGGSRPRSNPPSVRRPTPIDVPRPSGGRIRDLDGMSTRPPVSARTASHIWTRERCSGLSATWLWYCANVNSAARIARTTADPRVPPTNARRVRVIV